MVPTDAKPLAFPLGYYRKEGKTVYNEFLIPEYICLDSGLTKNISIEDVKLVAEVVKSTNTS